MTIRCRLFSVVVFYEVWLVFAHKRYIEIHRPEGEEEILFGSDVLDGGDLLPGFTMPVAEVFADPMAD